MENQNETAPRQDKLWSKKNASILFGVACANFMLGTCFSLPAPFFPNKAERKGASPTVYGFIFGSFPLVSLVMSPLWGKLMPYLVPKFVLVAGLFVAGSTTLMFGMLEFSPPGNTFIVLSFLVRIISAVGVTAYITTCYGILPVIFPAHIGTILSTMEMVLSFGTIVGPTLGGALYQADSFYLPFAVLGSCLLLATIFTSISFADKGIDVPDKKSGNIGKMLSSPGLVTDILVFSMGFVCIGFNDVTLEPHLRQFNLKPAALGSVFIISGGVFAFVCPIYGFLVDKGVKPHYFCAFGCALCLVAYLIIGPAPFMPFETSFPVIVVSLVLQGIGFGAKAVCSYFHGLKDIKRRGFPENVSTFALYQGIMTAFSSFGAFVGPSLGGILLHNVGYENGTLLVVVVEALLIVAVFVNIFTETSRKERSLTTVDRQPEARDSNDQDKETTPLIRAKI